MINEVKKTKMEISKKNIWRWLKKGFLYSIISSVISIIFLALGFADIIVESIITQSSNLVPMIILIVVLNTIIIGFIIEKVNVWIK